MTGENEGVLCVKSVIVTIAVPRYLGRRLTEAGEIEPESVGQSR